MLADRTFRENFTHYDPKALDDFLARDCAPELFAAQLRDPASRAWLVEASGEAVAYAKLGACKLPSIPAASDTIEFHRLYVLKSWQGRGLGARLMQAMFEEAKNRKARRIYLGVWEHNIAAQGFYAKYGFVKIGEYDYPPIGEVVDREWILCKEE